MLTIGDIDFRRIVSFVREQYGIDLSKKRALIQSRLALDIERRGYTSFSGYFDEIMRSPYGPECQHMIDTISTNHTFFFREPQCFEHLHNAAVPQLIKGGVKHINIWCAASSTGQECYAIAMVMEDALALYPDVSYSILGSDVNVSVLNTAKAGVYPIKEYELIPPSYLKRFCRKLGDTHFEIVPQLKSRISWKHINLAQPLTAFATGSCHFIFCRNVMIYFEANAKERLTRELHRILADNGHVYIGNTETLDMKRTQFRYLRPSVFEKKAVTY